MAPKTEKSHKLYYSIKEVAQMMNVNESLLRYWETEFPHLKPKTLANRVRQYTDKDIEAAKAKRDKQLFEVFRLTKKFMDDPV